MPAPSTEHTPPAELHALEMLRRTYKKKGYVFFDKHRYDLNIGGIRNPTTEPNRFDDSLFVAFIDRRWTWRVAMWSCTTDPGLYYLSQSMGNARGTAILIPGQYRRCWQIGKHKNKPALVQTESSGFKVWRDRNQDGSLDRSGRVYKDVSGLNCHKAHDWQSGKRVGRQANVDNWSAGCQVSEVSYAHDYVLMPLARKQAAENLGSKFTYTLFEAEDFKE